jgi:hypothetical protein
MTTPNPGKLVFKVFQGEPQSAVEEANAFIDGWDLQRFPITNAQPIWNEDQTKLTILLTIVAAPGVGKPDIARASFVPKNGNGA